MGRAIDLDHDDDKPKPKAEDERRLGLGKKLADILAGRGGGGMTTRAPYSRQNTALCLQHEWRRHVTDGSIHCRWCNALAVDVCRDIGHHWNAIGAVMHRCHRCQTTEAMNTVAVGSMAVRQRVFREAQKNGGVGVIGFMLGPKAPLFLYVSKVDVAISHSASVTVDFGKPIQSPFETRATFEVDDFTNILVPPYYGVTTDIEVMTSKGVYFGQGVLEQYRAIDGTDSYNGMPVRPRGIGMVRLLQAAFNAF